MTAMSLFSPAGTPSQEELLLKSPERFVWSHLKYMQRDSQKCVGQNREMLDPTLPTLRITQKKWNIWIIETSLLAMKEVSIQIRFVEKGAVECTGGMLSGPGWHDIHWMLHLLTGGPVDTIVCKHISFFSFLFYCIYVLICSLVYSNPKIHHRLHMEHYMTDSSFIRNNELAIDVDAAFSLSRVNHLNAWYSAIFLYSDYTSGLFQVSVK